jgi:tetratricopeptide (TPR) repeat protein
MVGALIDQAREALRLADVDPAASMRLGSTVADRARRARDAQTSAVAGRALGLAAVHLKDLDTALRHLRAAIRVATRASATHLAAEARMTLAFALSRRGRAGPALREIDAALLDLSGVARARAEAQRGAILHQLGRLDEALVAYRSALRGLRRAGDTLWMQRLLTNRGSLHGERHELVAAAADLNTADRLAQSLGLDLSAAHIQQNLGWVHMLRGDVPTALHHLDVAEERLRRLGSHNGTLLLTRSELLLSVLLSAEATEAAESAVRQFERERRRVALPEARLMLAQAASLEGDLVRAEQQARQAEREFTRQGLDRWASLARYVVLSCRYASTRTSAPAAQLARIADTLDGLGWASAALEARLTAGQHALAQGQVIRGIEQLAVASRARRLGLARLRARGWHAEALLRLARADRRGATSAVRAGLRTLDEHRATFGATDLRAFASGHRLRLAELGLRIAIDEGNAVRILTWAEQSRASHLLLRPIRPPNDPILAEALTTLRATVMDLQRARASGGNPVKLVQRQIGLERTIRDHCRRQSAEESGSNATQFRADHLAATLRDAALVEFVQLDDAFHAVTVVDGRIRWHTLCQLPPVRDLVDRLPFALHRLVRSHVHPASTAAAVTMLRDTAQRFDALLLRPLGPQIGDRPLVIVPTGLLQSLPWSILPSCASRPVTVSPSASLWMLASASAQAPPPVVAVAAGPGLPGARAEAQAVAAIHRTTPLVDGAATVAAIRAELGRASIAHIAAHGRLHTRNPLFSWIQLADGPLTIYDLEDLSRVPGMVILAACDSARSVVCAGDELLGISATFLAKGTQQVVASVLSIPDAETGPLMVAFHRLLAAGQTAPDALAHAQYGMSGEDPAVLAAAAGFVCIGGQFRS